jgi:HD-GYP domain-containing protein (c-di-GMP phosphodiesterase class II)
MMYLISKKMGVGKEKAERWKMASILHDVGKIGTPDLILKKPGRLTEEEYEVIKGHALIGHKLLCSNTDEFFPDAADIALSHHEKWAGNGYPNSLKGEEIPLPARILSVIDVFDALTHKRVYKDAWPVNKAVEYILEKKEEEFDPEIVDSFLAAVPELQKVIDEYPD